MIFDIAKEYGQELAQQWGLGDYADEANMVIMSEGNQLSSNAAKGLFNLDPITQLPYGSSQIYPSGTVVMPAIGARATIVEYQVPLGFTGIVNALQIVYTGGSFVSGSGELLFRVLVDNRAVRTLANVATAIGTINTTEPIAPFYVQSMQTIRIEVQHVSNAALGSPMNARIGGYIFPKTQ